MFGDQRFVELVKDKGFRIEKGVLICTYLLVTISTIFIYSATRNVGFVKRNLLWIFLGTIVMLIVMFFDYRELRKYIYLLYGVTAISLLSILFLGSRVLGATRWIKIFGIQLQPSEFAKIVIIITIAFTIERFFKDGVTNFFGIILAILPVIPLLLLILLQPDLGTTLILIASYLVMLYLSKANMTSIWIIGGIGLLALIPAYYFLLPKLPEYQQKRIYTFIDPSSDKQGTGWQVHQSKISVGAGRLTGRGVFQGSQSRLEFLPEAQTDFIFSIVAEETGFIGAFAILVIYFSLIFYILRVSRVIEDRFGKLILYGIAGIFFFHILINVGMTIGLVPVTGKPLLLLSYGGSSYLSSFIMIGLVESIKINVD